MDTRASSGMLTAAISAGLAAQGSNALVAGIIPTPGVAMLVVEKGAAAGIVVSASHNPFEYNGIKFFGPDGYKLPDATEELIEAELVLMLKGDAPIMAGRNRIGQTLDYTEGQAVYEDFIVSSCNKGLKGLKILLDCANGAAFSIAAGVFSRLGAEVVCINDRPDGMNINAICGATKPQGMADMTRRLGFDVGFAFDGDADRCILADELGNVLDGDFEMAILAGAMKEDGLLGGDFVVATAYSNMGLSEALGKLGLKQLTADNGDRYVLEMMQQRKLNLGGEQSGHILMLDRTTTGDGLLTAVRLAAIARHTGRKVSELASVMRKYPQGQRAVKVSNKDGLQADGPIRDAVAKAEAGLEGKGRVFVRASGTEPVVRVMVEAAEQEAVTGILNSIAELVQQRLS
jgi:phosphoglucosamine mutase